jgi:hypothetical protein
MSQGLGTLQRTIIQSLDAAEGRRLTAETLRWKIFEPSDGKDLEASSNNSFATALKSLEKRGHVEVELRPLESLAECVTHYPNKTLFGATRVLRLRFLPTLIKWMEAPDDPLRPKYGTASNERYQLKQLAQQGRLQEIQAQWCNIEKDLRKSYGIADGVADELLLVICKGRSLFRVSGIPNIEVQQAFSDIYQKACKRGSLSPSLSARLEVFLSHFLPDKEAGTICFKAFLHELADFSNTGQCALRKETLIYLYRHHRNEIRALEGFEEKSLSAFEAHRSSFHPRANDPIQFGVSPQLVRLFDKSVFQKFRFLSLSRSHGRSSQSLPAGVG